MKEITRKIFSALGSRLARNIYLWVILLYVVLETNKNNEPAYHYHIIQSPWYYPIIICSTLLQLILLYVNNLVLVPRLLARKRGMEYLLWVSLLISGVSIIYTIGLKAMLPYVDVSHLQQPGFVSAPVTGGWTFHSIIIDTESYLTGNFLWVFIFTMAWYMNDYARQRKALQLSEQKRVETELYFLKSQINPHFLFNTLNNIYGLSLQKSDAAPEVILKLSGILRYLLYESGGPTMPFEKEKEVMQSYIEVELLRLPDDISFQCHIQADRNYQLPPLLWLPVLENVFKHGARMISREYLFDYRFTITTGRLHIYAQNRYKNGYPDKAEGGVGLTNLRKRLELLYPGKYKLQAAGDGSLYTTEVTIEL